MAQPSKACCELPPVVSKYEPKGETIQLAGKDVYAVGSTSAKHAIIAVYDIIGMVNQSQQGADRLATALNALVLMPDFFKPATKLGVENFPPDTDKKKQTIQKFFAETANPAKNLEVLLKVVKEAKEKFTSVESWGAYGLCWGGKLMALVSGEGTPFKASGTAHPGLLDVSDAEKITIPYICLFSKEDGTPELVESYGDILKKNPKNYVETYGNMHHGWMGARANLEDEENLKEFTRGYDKLASFFAENL